jgi:glycosyltransferase involved in cell wall biosynthesis
MPPKLSVVIPNYNHGRHLPECLEALLNQAHPPSEIIVVDDGSTDNSVEIVQNLAKNHPQIRLFRHEKNKGTIHAVNLGLEKATGDYLFLSAADDKVRPEFLEKTLSLLTQHPNAALCGAICEFVETTTGVRYLFGEGICEKPAYLSPKDLVRLSRKNRLFMFTSAMVLRRDAILQVGLYNPDLRWHADWFLCFVAAFRFGVCFVPEVLSEFRKNPEGFSGRGMRDAKQQRAVLQKILEELDKPEFRAERELFREAAFLAPFGGLMLRLILRQRRYWHYLTPIYVRNVLLWSAYNFARNILPPQWRQAAFNIVKKIRGQRTTSARN